MENNTIYAAISDFPDYLITQNGMVYSKKTDRFLKPRKVNGYSHVTLCKSGLKKPISIHVLVATAFLGDRPHGLVVNHKNGIRTDNRISNLEWVSQSENVKHAYENKLRVIDDLHRKRAASIGRARRVCSEETERLIIEAYTGKRGNITALSKKFCVSRYVISGVISRSLKK
jgi:hypothetical protein